MILPKAKQPKTNHGFRDALLSGAAVGSTAGSWQQKRNVHVIFGGWARLLSMDDLKTLHKFATEFHTSSLDMSRHVSLGRSGVIPAHHIFSGTKIEIQTQNCIRKNSLKESAQWKNTSRNIKGVQTTCQEATGCCFSSCELPRLASTNYSKAIPQRNK